ncbi:hypothetical protein TNCT_591681 [Trichonephila clavata]|uniref:Uncharacterized protein n=1 Tax=Trichonephila clavata TaxID=2740835 RepID=A0A8X6M2M6_TRICU|nr:hypothetical protein TNCT_591681 [Trichonephila clavata]
MCDVTRDKGMYLTQAQGVRKISLPNSAEVIGRMSLRTPKKARGGPRWSIWRRASAGDGWDWRSTPSNSDDDDDYSYTRVSYRLRVILF